MFEMNSGTAWVDYHTKKQHWLLTTLKLLVMAACTITVLAFGLILAGALAVIIIDNVPLSATMSESTSSIIFGSLLVAIVATVYFLFRDDIWGAIIAMMDWALGRHAVLFID